jgi:hypothetical protein
MIDEVKQFAELFQGRTDAYGTWDGGAARSPVTLETFERHLFGAELIGIYPLRDEGIVRWGCSDIDVDDYDAACNLQTALLMKGVRSWIEKTRRGYHVWVFCSEWVTARVMRRALLAAHAAIGLPAKEVNPKQEEAKGLGNYVRLPYPSVFDEFVGVRFMMSDSGQAMELDVFLSEAQETLVTSEQLRPLAELFQPATKVDHTFASVDMQQARYHVNAYIRHIWSKGPREGQDRSNTLCYLSHLMREHGTPADYALAILRDADRKWGKFHLREDCDEQLAKIVTDTYGKR